MRKQRCVSIFCTCESTPCLPCSAQLADNSGFDATDVLNKLRQAHAAKDGSGSNIGIDVNTGGRRSSAGRVGRVKVRRGMARRGAQAASMGAGVPSLDSRGPPPPVHFNSNRPAHPLSPTAPAASHTAALGFTCSEPYPAATAAPGGTCPEPHPPSHPSGPQAAWLTRTQRSCGSRPS